MRPVAVAVFAAVVSLGQLFGDVAAAASTRPYDFDRNGRQDLAVGLPRYQPRGTPDAGAVVVLRGTSHGPSARPQVIFRGTRGVPGLPYGDDQFGRSLASADFDGDGYADLGVSAPGDRAVYAIYGSRRGLRARGTRRIALGPRLPPTEFPSPILATFATGDLNGDGFDDLVVCLAAGSGIRDRGSARVWFGSERGLSRRGARKIRGGRPAKTSCGSALALGDIDRDGHVDLVTGAPGFSQALDDPATPGQLTFCAGGAGGPSGCRRLLGRRPGPGSLAVADVSGDGYPDIVAGIPVTRTYGEDGPVPPGAVRIFLGGPYGPGRKGITVTPSSPGVPGRRHHGDAFGASVAAADLDHDRFADIIVGAAGDLRAPGRVTIIRGSAVGYAQSGNASFDQGTRGVPGNRRSFQAFGSALTVLDTDGHGAPELIIGVPGSRGGDRGQGALMIDSPRQDLAKRHATRISLSSLRLRAPEAPDTFTPTFGAVLGRIDSSSSTGDIFS